MLVNKLIEVTRMKYPSWARAISLAILLAPGVYSAVAAAAAPPTEFACQVATRSGAAGLVVIRADSLEQARQAVIGASAYTTDAVRSPATRVLQCIRRGEERFADYQFQQFYEVVPR